MRHMSVLFIDRNWHTKTWHRHLSNSWALVGTC